MDPFSLHLEQTPKSWRIKWRRLWSGLIPGRSNSQIVRQPSGQFNSIIISINSSLSNSSLLNSSAANVDDANKDGLNVGSISKGSFNGYYGMTASRHEIGKSGIDSHMFLRGTFEMDKTVKFQDQGI